MPTTLEQIQYGFDRGSRRTWQKRPLTSLQDQHYGYDTLSQVSEAARGSLNTNLTAISGTPVLAESWNYDPTGNWRGYQVAAAGTPTLDQHRVHDRGNRMTQIEGNPHNMILDRAGRMRQMSPDAEGDWEGKLEMTWDAWSRITKVRSNGAVVGEYTYDGAHRRVTREVEAETLHSYYNDAWRPVEERRDSETTASASYLWGSRHRDDLVRRDRAVGGTTLNESRYVLMDYFNASAITDGSGVVTERYAFSAFGVRKILNPDYSVRSSSESAMEFGFQGQFLDAESGLMNYGYRYYASQLGRWTCKDPIGEKGGMNLYEMVGNQALNTVDKDGLASPAFLAAGAAAAIVAAGYACGLWDALSIESWYPGSGDRFKHCYVACKISKRCGGLLAQIAGLSHEVMTEVGVQLFGESADRANTSERLRDSIGDISANSQCVGWESYAFGAVGGWIGACFRDSCEKCCDDKVGRNTWGGQ